MNIHGIWPADNEMIVNQCQLKSSLRSFILRSFSKESHQNEFYTPTLCVFYLLIHIMMQRYIKVWTTQIIQNVCISIMWITNTSHLSLFIPYPCQTSWDWKGVAMPLGLWWVCYWINLRTPTELVPQKIPEALPTVNKITCIKISNLWYEWIIFIDTI